MFQEQGQKKTVENYVRRPLPIDPAVQDWRERCAWQAAQVRLAVCLCLLLIRFISFYGQF